LRAGRDCRSHAANLVFPAFLAKVTTTPDTDSYPPTRLAFHASRITIDIGVLLVLAAMSLPFVTAEPFGQKAVAADALPALLLVLPIFVITLLPDQTRPVPSLLGGASLLLAATAAPYSVVKALDASTLAHSLGGRVGAGAWLLVVGTFVILAGIVYGLIRNLLHLPVAGTYPARPRPAEPASAHLTPDTGRTSSDAGAAPSSGARRHPPARPEPTAGAPPDQPPRPARGRPPAPSPNPAEPPSPTPPAGADPDTEPTLPAVKPVPHWWPDDLDNLFD
jgi:hypothetical protein